jgi:hypothetical protein
MMVSRLREPGIRADLLLHSATWAGMLRGKVVFEHQTETVSETAQAEAVAAHCRD